MPCGVPASTSGNVQSMLHFHYFGNRDTPRSPEEELEFLTDVFDLQIWSRDLQCVAAADSAQ